MQAIFMLVTCAVLNNQIQWDRCFPAESSDGTLFTNARDCTVARSGYNYDFGKITPDKSRLYPIGDGTAVSPLVQWKTRFSEPFHMTAACIKKNDAMFLPVP